MRVRSHPQRFNFRPIQSRNALTCQGCLFSRNITLVIHISSPSQLGQKKKRPTRMIALIIYVRVTSHSNYSQTRWLKRKKKKKRQPFYYRLTIFWVKNLGQAQLGSSSAPYGSYWNHSVEFSGRKGWSGGPDGFTPRSGAQGAWLEGWAQLAWRGFTWPFQHNGLRVVRLSVKAQSSQRVHRARKYKPLVSQ